MSSSLFLFLSVLLVVLVPVLGQPQQFCRVDGFEYPCPRVVESLYLDYRVYGAVEVVAYTGLPVGKPLDILLSLITGEEQILRYFNRGNRANESIPHTFPRGIIVDIMTHRYIPVVFLPNAYLGGRAPASTIPMVHTEGVDPFGRVEPIVVPMLERPTDTLIRDTVFAAHFILRQHGQSYLNSTFAFFSYDLATHRGPGWDSEVWVFPPVPATATASE